MNQSLPLRLVFLNLLCVGALLSLGFAPMPDEYWAQMLQEQGKMNLPVQAILQSKATSCGEAAIVMAYNYAYPETRVTEAEVIEYAVKEGYYTKHRPPFTSPENMVKIAEFYASNSVSTGTVNNADEGLALLTQKLTAGEPVIIDSFARLDKPKSGAHFILVTGLSVDPENPDATRIYFNDPLTGSNRSSAWLGGEGIWNAWKNNRDPGGSGWWMVISSP